MTTTRTANRTATLPDYLNTDQLMAKLQVDRSTLWRWRADGRIPYIRIASAILFDPAAVADALAKLTVHGNN